MSRLAEFECWLPAEPFRLWLQGLRQREADRMDVDWERATKLLAGSVGMSARRLREYLRPFVPPAERGSARDVLDWIMDAEADLVPLSTVDRIVQARGTWAIQEIYEVYWEADIPAIGRWVCRECGIDLARPAVRCGFCIEEEVLLCAA